MKKLIFGLIATIMFTGLSFGQNENFSLISKSTSTLSKGTINLGVKEILINGTSIKLSTFKGFYLNKALVNLSNYDFKYSENILSFNNNNNYKIYSIKSQLYVETPKYKGILNNMDIKLIQDDVQFKVLLVLLGELTAIESVKVTFDSMSKSAGGGSCSFWNTVYSVGIGLSSNAAWADYNYSQADDINSGNLTGCVSLGSPEHSQIGVVHYVTKSWCCR